MRATGCLLIALGLLAGLALAQAGPTQYRPYLGYLCSAGGQRGTVVRVVAGGQNLRGADRVVVSGEGVHAKVLGHQRPSWLLTPDQRRLLAQELRRLATAKLTGQSARGRSRAKPPKQDDGKEEVTLPDDPMLRDLESLSPKELRRVAYEYLDLGRRAQLSPQIAETVTLEVTIDANAAPGERELRIGTPRGLSNPMPFHVGLLPEVHETEPNDYASERQPVVELPQVVNGQVTFKDIDRFRLRARKGQRLVIETHARRLVPYLADAVPGWFQATLSLSDARGEEIGFADDYRFDPDPVLFFEVPEDGLYQLEIRDAIYRGREDFVYRITIAERPFITSLFPMGGKVESATIAEITGWNLPWDEVLLDTWPDAERIRRATWGRAGLLLTNGVQYAVDTWPERLEIEPNDRPERAQLIEIPEIVNGRIGRAGEADVYRFAGRAGDRIVAEVEARRLGSPLDSLLQLIDDTGRVLAFNDDFEDPTAGLVTHQADSYLSARLPSRGSYVVRVSDAQCRGGEDFAYRLRIGPPQPDFAVMVTPSALSVPGGGHIVFTAHAVRKDGFEGEIELEIEDAPQGFALSGGRIPAGRDSIRMTFTAPAARSNRPIPTTIRARARIDGRDVTHPVIPAEDMMQAFGLRHLVAAEQLLVDVTRPGRRGPAMRLDKEGAVRIPRGGAVEVRIRAQALPPLDRVEFVMSEPPDGVILREVRADRGGLVVVLAAERGKVVDGLEENLIIEAWAEIGGNPRGARGNRKDEAKPTPTRRVFAGVLPAIPVTIPKLKR